MKHKTTQCSTLEPPCHPPKNPTCCFTSSPSQQIVNITHPSIIKRGNEKSIRLRQFPSQPRLMTGGPISAQTSSHILHMHIQFVYIYICVYIPYIPLYIPHIFPYIPIIPRIFAGGHPLKAACNFCSARSCTTSVAVVPPRPAFTRPWRSAVRSKSWELPVNLGGTNITHLQWMVFVREHTMKIADLGVPPFLETSIFFNGHFRNRFIGGT